MVGPNRSQREPDAPETTAYRQDGLDRRGRGDRRRQCSARSGGLGPRPRTELFAGRTGRTSREDGQGASTVLSGRLRGSRRAGTFNRGYGRSSWSEYSGGEVASFAGAVTAPRTA